jgi:H/ACA ribonucleoprotein complex subunit 4
MIKKGELDKYGAKIPGTTPKDWSEGYVDYKEDGVVTFGGSTIATQPQASTSAAAAAPSASVVEVDDSMKVDAAAEDKKEKKRKRKSEVAEDGDKTVDAVDGEKKKVSRASSVGVARILGLILYSSFPNRRKRRPRPRTAMSRWP